jgi:polyisoprenyl-phosphate glycosyltransferase
LETNSTPCATSVPEPVRPQPRISTAIPIYNEESVLPELLRRVGAVLESIPGGPHEMVFADDGSSDRSLAILQQAAQSDTRIVAISLSRNFGHQSALGAALDYTTGDVIVILDGDLQDDPELIPQFLAEYNNGYDVVYAIRAKRKEGLIKRVCYSAFYRLIDSVADLRLPRGSGDFALLSRRVVDLIRLSPERHRYLRGLRTWYGFSQKGIEVERSARHSGQPKFSIRRLFGLAFDGIFAFSIIPIRIASALGLLVVFCSVLFAGYSLFAKIFFDQTKNQSPPGFTALIFAITFLGGMQLLFLGIAGEYIGRIYNEVKRRPHYVVKKVIRAD